MFCPNCGHQIPDGSLFCPDCGQSTQSAAQPVQPDGQANAAQSNPAPSAAQGDSQANAGQADQQPPVYNAEPVGQQTTYQYQYTAQFTPDTRRMNGLCVAGFVVGIVSVFLNFWGIMGIVALVLSAMGLSSCAKHNQRGKGLAIAGLVLGIIGVVWGLLSICVCSSSAFLAAL